MDRLCSKPACTRPATATLTYDYPSRGAAIGPLAPTRTPLGHDLCAVHAGRFVVPDGWTLVRHVESSGDF